MNVLGIVPDDWDRNAIRLKKIVAAIETLFSNSFDRTEKDL